MNKSLIILKPDALEKHLAGEILTRFEKKGFTILQTRVLKPTLPLVEQHYAHLKDKPDIFQDTCNYMTSGNVMVVLLGLDTPDPETPVSITRKLVGATDPCKADVGTIRSDYATDISRNIIHASDSAEAVELESSLWFDLRW